MSPVEVRDAATVMLVRDGADGLEVFMVQRNLSSAFVAGAYVFPGGAVDDADRHLDLGAVTAGRSDEAASRRLDVGFGGLAYWVAAIRESFEEAGVLLACDRDGKIVSFADPEVAERFRVHREAVDRGDLRLVDMCLREGLVLAVDQIHYFAHWITPEGPPRRYDTRFFVAAAPPEQVPLHDDRETIAHIWVRPAEALDRHRRGEIDMIAPTIRNLQAIGRFDRSADLLAHAQSIGEVPAIQPRLIEDGGGTRIVLPGDDGYDTAGEGLREGQPLPGQPGGPTVATDEEENPG